MSPIDQEKLLPVIRDQSRVVWNVRRLIDGAKVLGIPVAATEQYPRGLGPTTQELSTRLAEIPDKLTFSCGGCPEIFERFRDAGFHVGDPERLDVIFRMLVSNLSSVWRPGGCAPLESIVIIETLRVATPKVLDPEEAGRREQQAGRVGTEPWVQYSFRVVV